MSRAQPGQTLKSLTEAKNLLEQTRNELTEAKERAQIKPTHTFSPLPPSIFFPRPTEVRAVENALMGQPSWTVVFGASSTGKVCCVSIAFPSCFLSAPIYGRFQTAILRHVLSNPRYHVLHFDLRIAGFADLAGLHMSLWLVKNLFEKINQNLMVFRSSQQMEQYFAAISETMEGYGDFEVEALAFKVCFDHCLAENEPRAHGIFFLKHERLSLERRLGGTPQDDCASAMGGSVNTSDIARLMEMFQVRSPVLRMEPRVDPSVPRVRFSSTGTSNLLMMRTCAPI